VNQESHSFNEKTVENTSPVLNVGVGVSKKVIASLEEGEDE
jgi:hypothetical protein